MRQTLSSLNPDPTPPAPLSWVTAFCCPHHDVLRSQDRSIGDHVGKEGRYRHTSINKKLGFDNQLLKLKI